MADEKAVQRRPRKPIDRLIAVLQDMDDETLIAAQYVVRGFVARGGNGKRPAKVEDQAMLELGASAAEES